MSVLPPGRGQPAPCTLQHESELGCCSGRVCLGSCYVRVHGLWVQEMVWGGRGSGGPQCGCMHGNAWQYKVQLAEDPGSRVAFGSCMRRSKKEPPMVTVFCNGMKGKKLARSCVCSPKQGGLSQRSLSSPWYCAWPPSHINSPHPLGG